MDKEITDKLVWRYLSNKRRFIMKFVLGPIKAILRIPYKAGIAALLIGLGIYLGGAKSISAYGKEAVRWIRPSGYEIFDPDILERPEKELDLIQSVKNDVMPRIKKVQILIRKQVAQVEYMKEKCRFLEQHVSLDEKESRSAEQVLSELAAAVQNGNISTEQRRLYEIAQVWGAFKEKIGASERALKELYGIESRVTFLQGKLEERRLATLKYVPERIPSSDKRIFVISDIEEARGLLEEAHETLFKTVVSLNPGFLKEEQPLVTASHSLTQ